MRVTFFFNDFTTRVNFYIGTTRPIVVSNNDFIKTIYIHVQENSSVPCMALIVNELLH